MADTPMLLKIKAFIERRQGEMRASDAFAVAQWLDEHAIEAMKARDALRGLHTRLQTNHGFATAEIGLIPPGDAEVILAAVAAAEVVVQRTTRLRDAFRREMQDAKVY